MGRQSTLTGQSGSTLSFIIVGVVLVCLVVGGVFALRSQGDKGVVPEEITSSTASKNSDKSQAQKGAESTGAASSDTAKSGASSTKQSTTKSTDSNRSTPPVAVGASSELPQTGPASTLVTVAMLSILAGVGVAYMQSRRQLVTSLNK